MNTSRLPKIRQLSVLALSIVASTVLASNAFGTPPVKLILENRFGREVNLTQTNLKTGPEQEDTCTTNSKNSCLPGTPSTITGGFTYPESVAGAPNGNFYVADQGNARIDEFTANGKFILTFGTSVDPTGANKNICTATSKDPCAAGVKGASPGQLDVPESIAVNSLSGNIYVAETIFGEVAGQGAYADRVQEFTNEGEFLLEIGEEVNVKTKGNICIKSEECSAPTLKPFGTQSEGGHGVISFKRGRGNLLAVGGLHDRLYVAGADGIQEFEPGGSWIGETHVPNSEVTGIAVESATNMIYAVYNGDNVVHKLDSEGHENGNFMVSAREAGEEARVTAMAMDRLGHLALAVLEEPEEGHGSATTQFGALYEAATGNLLTQFVFEGMQVKGIGFNNAENASKEPADELFAAATGMQEILSYTPVSVAELLSGQTACVAGKDEGSSATFNCTIEAFVNPYSVPSTTAWFEWGGTCALGSDTPKQPLSEVTEVLPIRATLSGLRPNGLICYRVAGEDKNVIAPERLTAEKKEYKSPMVPPRVVGDPSVSFVKSSSVVMFGEVDPENTLTAYVFEYEPCQKFDECSGATQTTMQVSEVYGGIGVAVEATGLQPATMYRYRLLAINEAEEEAECFDGGEEECEGTFTTTQGSVPKARTEGVTDIGMTSAMVSGSIDPDGQPVTYAFELGIAAGASTQYGVVQSGSTQIIPVRKTLQVSGLQPATEYEYRISVKSSYGTVVGQSMKFTTVTVPSLKVPSPPVLLPMPPEFSFPMQKVAKCNSGYSRGKRNKCVKIRKHKKTVRKDRKHK